MNNKKFETNLTPELYAAFLAGEKLQVRHDTTNPEGWGNWTPNRGELIVYDKPAEYRIAPAATIELTKQELLAMMNLLNQPIVNRHALSFRDKLRQVASVPAPAPASGRPESDE